MTRVNTIPDLKQAWHSLLPSLQREPGGVQRLLTDPVGLFRDLGYELDLPARRALLAAIPGLAG